MGGEITWDCAGGGKYIFTLKLYRDCNSTHVSSSVSLNVWFHPSITSILMDSISQTDISPGCNAAGPAITCAAASSAPGWPSSPTPIAGAVQETVYQSAPISIPGVPPATGWVFTFDECCRNTSLTNLNAAIPGTGMELRAIMYAYNGMNDNPCFDSSPKFQESPSSVICTGYPYTYNPNAYDPDLDSLTYSWAQPLNNYVSGAYNPPTNPGIVPFNSGFSYTSPLPGTSLWPSNVPATINSHTGEISFTSFTQGYFVTDVKVQSWKCGQLVAEIYREMEVILLPCATNNPPAVTLTSFQDTVLAGSVVNFSLLADGITPQTVNISATGTEFGTGFTSTTTGCLHTPCATLSPASPTSGTTNAATTFNWQTSCNDISNNSSCNTHSNTFTFVFKTKDDFCPAPAERISTVSITVLALPIVNSPQPRCVSVLPSGDVTLTWSTPLDTGGTFNAYLIYTSNAPGGPFTLLDSIFTYTQTTYTHLGANANVAPVYYYIRTRSGCSGAVISPAIDTVSSIHLTVNNPLNGTALLNWNPIAIPNISTSTGVYNIYQEFPAGVWTLIGTTTNLNYIDTIYICNATIHFRVEIADNTGCISVSSVDGGIFQNTIAPSIPVFDTLSVNNNNNAMMSWNVNPSPDVVAYIVYQFNGTAWIPIDTVFGINNISYTYLGSNAGSASEQYRLTGLDSCGNECPLSAVFRTIYLTSVANICARSVDLHWTAYPTIGTGLAGYRIYRSVVGTAGPYTLIGTAPPGTLTFNSPGLAASTMYYYKVEAYDTSGLKTASSNRINFYSAVPIPPTFSYLRKVSVTAPDQVDVSCHIDVAASTLKYKIMRSLDTVSTNFVEIGTKPASATTPVTYTDNTALTDKNSYYYKIINVDSCGYDGMVTNIGRTILLNAVSNSTTMTNSMWWNDYESWLGTVMQYNIYRGVDGVMDPTPIGNVAAGGTNYYTDDISTMLQGQGVFDYYVEALEGMGNTYGFSENSLSNIAEAYQDPIIYIPNAFRPTGVNTVFIPVTTFVDITDYEFDVFNRWGLQVFSTTNKAEGWDGTHKGDKQEFGVYVYLIRFRTSKGDYKEFKGSVNLLR